MKVRYEFVLHRMVFWKQVCKERRMKEYCKKVKKSLSANFVVISDISLRSQGSRAVVSRAKR